MWHGANWTFVIWGGVHGLAQILENMVKGKVKDDSRGALWMVKVLLVFCFCTFAWIFFVSKSLPDAIYVIGHMFEGISRPSTYFKEGIAALLINSKELTTMIISIIILLVYDYLSLKLDVIIWLSNQKWLVRWSLYYVFVFYMLLNVSVEKSSFIYFQF